MQHPRMYLVQSTRNDADESSGWGMPTSSQPVHAGTISSQPERASVLKEQGAT